MAAEAAKGAGLSRVSAALATRRLLRAVISAISDMAKAEITVEEVDQILGVPMGWPKWCSPEKNLPASSLP